MKIIMKISTEIASAAKIVGEERAVEYCARVGFDAWDFSMFAMCNYDGANRCLLESTHPLTGERYLEFARRLKQIGLDNGIVCNQSHAPFPSDCAEIRSYHRRAIECTAEAGGEICVIHPDTTKSVEENAEMFLELLPFAKEHKVKIATENMWDWDIEKNQSCFASCATPKSFNDHLDAVDDEYFVACLDIGHAEMKGNNTNAIEMIRKLGGRLLALHIHDNDKWYDCHQIPFSMNIDFSDIVKALKEIDYKGYFTLEADSYLEAYTQENIICGMQNLAEAARKLANMFDK